MHRHRALVAALLALALGGLVAAPIRAQQPSPEVVDPSQCQVQPRPVEFFQQLAANAAPQATPGGATNPTPPPVEGQPADQATVDAVTATYRELVACLNAGDYLRAYALYTDGYLQRNFKPDSLSSIGATPVPVPESTRIAFGGVQQVVILPDGRVGALVAVTGAAGGTPTTTNTVFARVGDRFLIDEETVADAAPASPAA